ncbi:MAG: ATPase domain-containing protein [Myxococcota bacterium]
MAEPLSPSSTPSPTAPPREVLVPFGLEPLDAQIQGFIRDKLYLLYGPQSALKTALALTFMWEGLKSDRGVVYVTSQDPEALLLQADRLGYNLRPYLRQDQLTLLTYLPRLSQQVALLTDYRRVTQELRRMAGDQPLERVIFDPVELLVASDNRAMTVPATRLLIDALKGLGVTTLCLVDEADDPQTQALLKEFEFLSFGAFQLDPPHEGAQTLHFRKVVWNPKEYPLLPLTLKTKQGAQVIELVAQAQSEGAVSVNSSSAEVQQNPVSLAQRLRLLLIDNDEFYHQMLEDFLKDRYDVELVTDSVEAISRLFSRSYDAILVNMNMPRIDGREVCLRIRQHQGPVPLIAFSNKLKRGADIAGVLRIGADAFIARPMAFNQVKATLDAVLRRPAGPQQFQRARDLIREILDEQEALKHLVAIEPSTGLIAPDYFEARLRRELSKAQVGDYSFAVVGYFVRPRGSFWDPDPFLRSVWQEQLRMQDMALQYAPGFYVVFLDECLPPGVKRFNERLRKFLTAAAQRDDYLLEYEVVIYPTDAHTYEELLERALKPLRDAHAQRG